MRAAGQGSAGEGLFPWPSLKSWWGAQLLAGPGRLHVYKQPSRAAAELKRVPVVSMLFSLDQTTTQALIKFHISLLYMNEKNSFCIFNLLTINTYVKRKGDDEGASHSIYSCWHSFREKKGGKKKYQPLSLNATWKTLCWIMNMIIIWKDSSWILKSYITATCKSCE